jgi:hypothetical protein
MRLSPSVEMNDLQDCFTRVMQTDLSRLVAAVSTAEWTANLSGVEQTRRGSENRDNQALTWVACVPVSPLTGGGCGIGLRRIGYFSSPAEAALVRDAILRRADGNPVGDHDSNFTELEWSAVLRVVSLLEKFKETHCSKIEDA